RHAPAPRLDDPIAQSESPEQHHQFAALRGVVARPAPDVGELVPALRVRDAHVPAAAVVLVAAPRALGGLCAAGRRGGWPAYHVCADDGARENDALKQKIRDLERMVREGRRAREDESRTRSESVSTSASGVIRGRDAERVVGTIEVDEVRVGESASGGGLA
ncbi:hypothetical protein V490_03329, partial [Pseudogymnoascus sp. VKM F-3557]